MNKKITAQSIKLIALQMILVIIAVTAVGGAVITHNQFKSTANKGTPVASGKTVDAGKKDVSGNVTTEAPVEYEYSYAGFNPKVITLSKDLSKVILNSENRLPDNYSPSLSEAVNESNVMLDRRVAPYYQAMYDAAKEDGLTLTPISGYRSVEQQKKNFDLKVQSFIDDEALEKKEATVKAAETILLPGTSEHNAGLAVDICSLSESFENSEEFEWLSEHAADYGFILRYPKEAQETTKVNYQPWHYRYVGIRAAQEISKRGITLEEFLNP